MPLIIPVKSNFINTKEYGFFWPPAGQNPFEKGFRHLPKLFIRVKSGITEELIYSNRIKRIPKPQ